MFLEDEASVPSAVKNRGKADTNGSKGDFKKLYRNFDIIFEITFIIGVCAIIDVARFSTALGLAAAVQ